MKPCPCECGRQLGWSDSRVAKSASEVLARLPYVYRIALHTDREAPGSALVAHQFLDAGVAYVRAVLEVAHGDHSMLAQRMMPPISEGTRWIRKADQLRPAIAKIDPEWWSWYRGVGMPKAAIEVSGDWQGQLRGGAQRDEPQMPDMAPSNTASKETDSYLELATVSPRVAGLIGAHEINWMIAKNEMDKLLNLPDQRPCTGVALAAQLNCLAEIASQDKAARAWMMDKTNMTRAFASIHIGYGVGRLALGTTESANAGVDDESKERGPEISDFARRLDFSDVVAASPMPSALAATVDGISAEEALARLADPIGRLEVLGQRNGFLTAVAEEIVLGGDDVGGLDEPQAGDQLRVEGTAADDPATVIKTHLEAIGAAYNGFRATERPVDSLFAAMEETIPPEHWAEVRAFALGDLDDRFGGGAGYAATMPLILQFDVAGGFTAAPDERSARWQSVDIATAAEEIGSDPLFTDLFMWAMHHNQDAEAGELGAVAAATLVANARTAASTKTGQSVKIETAESVLRRLAKKGRGPEHQATWCTMVANVIAMQR